MPSYFDQQFPMFAAQGQAPGLLQPEPMGFQQSLLGQDPYQYTPAPPPPPQKWYQDADKMEMLGALGQGLLASSGWSAQPQTFGEGLARGMAAVSDVRDKQAERKRRKAYEDLQKAQQKRLEEQAEREYQTGLLERQDKADKRERAILGIMEAYPDVKRSAAEMYADNPYLLQLKGSGKGDKRDTQVIDGRIVDMQTGEVLKDFGRKSGGDEAKYDWGDDGKFYKWEKGKPPVYVPGYDKAGKPEGFTRKELVDDWNRMDPITRKEYKDFDEFVAKTNSLIGETQGTPLSYFLQNPPNPYQDPVQQHLQGLLGGATQPQQAPPPPAKKSGGGYRQVQKGTPGAQYGEFNGVRGYFVKE